MKKLLLIVVIYLSGYVCCYEFTKYDIQRQTNSWLVQDRTFSLIWSVYSWAGVLCLGSMYTIHYIQGDGTLKANW